jgi:hypothetical protein
MMLDDSRDSSVDVKEVLNGTCRSLQIFMKLWLRVKLSRVQPLHAENILSIVAYRPVAKP